MPKLHPDDEGSPLDDLPGPKPNIDNSAAEVSIISAAGINPEPISWIWEGWVAQSKVHILAGPPGTGKTTLAVALAATSSVGGRWPDGTRADVGHAVIWSGEDDPKDTLVPRLIACGADLDRVHFISGVVDGNGSRAFDPATDGRALSEQMALMDPTPNLLVVDPIVSAVAGDSHKNAEVRRSLQPLVDLAQTRQCAVIGISHFSKGSIGRDPVERVVGSMAFGALSRIVLAAAKLPDTEGGGRLLARAKNNLGPDTGGFKYDLQVCEPISGIQTTRVLWGDPVEGTARELLANAEVDGGFEEQSMLEDAKEFLRSELADGPVASRSIKRESDGAGHSWGTIRRAQTALGIVPRKEGKFWMWALPHCFGAENRQDDHEGAQVAQDSQRGQHAQLEQLDRNPGKVSKVFRHEQLEQLNSANGQHRYRWKPQGTQIVDEWNIWHSTSGDLGEVAAEIENRHGLPIEIRRDERADT